MGETTFSWGIFSSWLHGRGRKANSCQFTCVEMARPKKIIIKNSQRVIYGISSPLVESFDSPSPCFLCKYNTIKPFSAGNKILENQSRFGHLKRWGLMQSDNWVLSAPRQKRQFNNVSRGVRQGPKPLLQGLGLQHDSQISFQGESASWGTGWLWWQVGQKKGREILECSSSPQPFLCLGTIFFLQIKALALKTSQPMTISRLFSNITVRGFQGKATSSWKTIQGEKENEPLARRRGLSFQLSHPLCPGLLQQERVF